MCYKLSFYIIQHNTGCTMKHFRHRCALAALAIGAALCMPTQGMAQGASAAAALSAQQLHIASQVHIGRMPCELGAYVTVHPDQAQPGHFFVHGKGFRYHMVPVETRTGAVRLEDARAGAVWLQIADKSMLMNQKLGLRVADACTSVAQAQVREDLRRNPRAGVLDAAGH